MSGGFKVDARKMLNALDTVAVTLRKAPDEVIKPEARLLLQRAQMGFTAPKTLAQGRAKVKSDIYGGLFQIYSPAIVENPIQGNFVTLWGSKKEKKAFIVKTSNFWPDASMEQMRKWHNSRYANTQSNRIKLRYPRAFSGGNVHGKFTDLNRPAVQRNVLERYIRMMQGRVGRLKAGWNKSLKAVGGKIPSWVARHGQAENDYGLVLNNLGRRDYPSITVGNAGPSITRWRKEWQTLLDTRARDMVKRAQYLVRKAKKEGKF